jgi:branched-chain amino acid aminotransferase
MIMPEVWLNHQFVDEEVASVSLRDAGLLHGAGIFTTVRARNGKIFRLDRHLARLRDSADALFVPLKYTDAVFEQAAVELLARNHLTDARLRLTATRGVVSQDPLHGMMVEPNVFLTAAPFNPYPAEYYQKGLTVILIDEQKLNPYDLQAGHKTLDYFSRLSALRAANTRNAGEALLFNVHNYLQSGSISNVFLVEDGKLITPPTAQEMRQPALARLVPYSRSNVLPGITRAAVMELAPAAGLEVQTLPVNVSRLLEANEIFLTNSIMGIMPVVQIEKKTIGEGRPGPVTLDLGRRLTQLIEEETR